VAAPSARGEGGGGNGCLGVDEREMGQKKGMERRPATFQATRWRGAEGGKGEGVPCGRSHVEMEEEGRGGPGMVVGSAGRPATTPDRRAWAAALPREQGRGRGWATQCGRLTRRLERDGDPVSVTGHGRERPGGDGAPTGGPGQHSAGAAVQTVF
jgi:hypothetical protein